MTIDFEGVPFIVTAGVLAWFEQQGGAYWFTSVDPFLRMVRKTFGGDVSKVELHCSLAGLIYVKRIRHDGSCFEDSWRFTFDRRGDTFTKVAA